MSDISWFILSDFCLYVWYIMVHFIRLLFICLIYHGSFYQTFVYMFNISWFILLDFCLYVWYIMVHFIRLCCFLFRTLSSIIQQHMWYLPTFSARWQHLQIMITTTSFTGINGKSVFVMYTTVLAVLCIWYTIELFYFWFKYDLDRSTTHPEYDPTGVWTHDLHIKTWDFMWLRRLL